MNLQSSSSRAGNMNIPATGHPEMSERTGLVLPFVALVVSVLTSALQRPWHDVQWLGHSDCGEQGRYPCCLASAWMYESCVWLQPNAGSECKCSSCNLPFGVQVHPFSVPKLVC